MLLCTDTKPHLSSLEQLRQFQSACESSIHELEPNSSSNAIQHFQNQSSRLVIDLSEQVSTLNSELEQARQTITELRQRNQ